MKLKYKKLASGIYEYLNKKLNHDEYKVFKPMPAPVDKIKNKFRWRIIIKGKMSEEANLVLNQSLKDIYNTKNLKNTNIAIDVNPNSMI